ncbi:MAG: hypothetical protein MJ221_02015 [Bacilli bacterium]|nr:hypothetical protein [Bacilli bacterium]
MKIFSKRETLAQNMALMGIMSAINIIIAVVCSLVPWIAIFLILILPLTSVLVEIFCKDKYYPIYALATFGLALVATLWNMETTIFYVLPSLLTGYVFGLLAKKKIPSIYSILGSSLIQMGLTLAFIPLINFIFGVDVVLTFKTFFNLADSKNIDVIVPAFIFVISLIQMALSYIIISEEIKKIGVYPIAQERFQWIYQLVLGIISLSIIGVAFLSLEVAYVLLMISIYLSVFIIIDYISSKYWHILIIFGAGIILNVIIFALYFTKIKEPAGMLLIGVFPLWIAFISTLVSFLKRKPKEIQ